VQDTLSLYIGPIDSTYKQVPSEKNWSSDFDEIFTQCTGYRRDERVTNLQKSDKGFLGGRVGRKKV